MASVRLGNRLGDTQTEAEVPVAVLFDRHKRIEERCPVPRHWVSFVFDSHKNRISNAPQGDLHVASLHPVLHGVLEDLIEELSDPVVLALEPQPRLDVGAEPSLKLSLSKHEHPRANNPAQIQRFARLDRQSSLEARRVGGALQQAVHSR